MKIAICGKSEGLNSEIDDRFGRCENFIIIDNETNEVKTIENVAKNEAGGAGGIAVRNLSKENVSVIISTKLGPKADIALKSFEIKAYNVGNSKTVKEAFENYKNGLLTEIIETVKEHSGLRRV